MLIRNNVSSRMYVLVRMEPVLTRDLLNVKNTKILFVKHVIKDMIYALILIELKSIMEYLSKNQRKVCQKQCGPGKIGFNYNNLPISLIFAQLLENQKLM